MILRTYVCPECNYIVEVELRADQWAELPPNCPNCIEPDLLQDFKPPAIGGSNQAKAVKMAQDIAERDYGVADLQTSRREGAPTKVRYRDQSPGTSSWGAANAAMAQAVALGRENRLRYGSGLEVLQTNLKNGTQPDLIELSKRRSAKIW